MDDREFEPLLDALAGLAAANIVLVETLHEHRVLDKTHFAHAFARALDGLAPEHRGGMIERVLRNMRDRCMNLPGDGESDAREWLKSLLEDSRPALMKFSIAPRPGYLLAQITGRETAGEMREFLIAVQAACRSHGSPKILMRVTRSRPVFKPEDYGLAGNMRGYVTDLVTPKCQVALLGDTAELNAAHEYIEVVARQQDVNVRAFSDEASALRWLEGAPAPERRYRFARLVLLGAPDDAGVYSLWDGEEIIYYGRAAGGTSGTIRARLLDHFNGKADPASATHYSWELCPDPVTREADLLRRFREMFGHLPRGNSGLT